MAGGLSRDLLDWRSLVPLSCASRMHRDLLKALATRYASLPPQGHHEMLPGGPATATYAAFGTICPSSGGEYRESTERFEHGHEILVVCVGSLRHPKVGNAAASEVGLRLQYVFRGFQERTRPRHHCLLELCIAQNARFVVPASGHQIASTGPNPEERAEVRKCSRDTRPPIVPTIGSLPGNGRLTGGPIQRGFPAGRGLRNCRWMKREPVSSPLLQP